MTPHSSTTRRATTRRTRRITAAGLAGSAALLAGAPGVAAADTTTYGRYHGELVALSADGTLPPVCVLDSDPVLDCYDSAAQATEALGLTGEGVTLDALSSGCPAGYLCLYDDENFENAAVYIAKSGTQHWVNLSFFNNRMESWANNSNRTAVGAEDYAGEGSWLTMASYSEDNAAPAEWKNVMSSVYF